MINQIKNIVKNPLFSGSAVMIIGSNMANAIAYIYHFVIGRMLGPSSYGELAAVLSILGLLFTAFNFLGLVIVKFVSAAKKNEVYSILIWFTGKLYKMAIGLSIVLLFLTPVLSEFLKIELKTTLLVVPIVYISFLAFIYRSFAQGLLKFFAVVVSTNIDMLLRLVVGVILISLGFSVFGTVVGILVSMSASYIYLKWFISKNIPKDKGKAAVEFGGKVFKYSLPILIATLTTNSMFSTDVILVKHYFDAHDAGIYASLSTLGKIIFYGTGPVTAVMFPMIAKRYSEKQKSKKIFYLSILMTTGISSVVLFLYYLFPEIAIKVLFGDKYLEGANYLFMFGIFMSLFALSSLIFNYFLSVERTKVVAISIVVSLLQIAGILIWHGSIIEVLNVSIYSTLIFLIALIVYYFYYAKTNEGKF